MSEELVCKEGNAQHEKEVITVEQLLSRIDLEQLFPPFREKIIKLVKNCHARGAHYWAISGMRTWKEQQALYDQGRTKPGNIVTKAKPGTSAHNYGIAVDFVLDKDQTRAGLQPDWELDAFKILAEEAKKLGLESGYYWTRFKDAPHVQLPMSAKKITFADLQTKYKNGELPAVWAYLRTFDW